MSDDHELLRRYAEEGSEQAFGDLVRRHAGWVYGVALCLVDDDAHSAEDIAQRVFCDLARKARSVSRHPAVSAWLHRSTHYAASDVRRAELRRRQRTKEATLMEQLSSNSDASVPPDRLAAVLDQVLNELGDRDRNAVMLRFFEGRGFADLGGVLRLTEDAARMRVDRALEKMRTLLARRGITSSQAAIAAALAGEASLAAPIGIAANITGAALAGAGATLPIAAFLMSITKIQLGIAGAVLVAGLGLVALQRQALPGRSDSKSEIMAPGMSTTGKTTPNPKELSGNGPAGSPPAGLAVPAKPTIAGLLADSDIPRRTAAMAKLLAESKEGDLQPMLGELEQAPDSLAKWKLFTAVYKRWGELAPADALASLQGLTQRQTEARQDEILSGWLIADPENAWIWAVAHPTGSGMVGTRNVRLEGVVQQLLDADQSDTALRLALSMPDLPQPGSAIRNSAVLLIVNDLMAYDPERVISWALTLPLDTSVLRTNVLQRIGNQLARQSPSQTADFATRISEDDAKNFLMIMGSPAQISGRGGIFDGDAAAVSEFINRLAPGAVKDSAAGEYVALLARTDQVAARALIESQFPPEKRQRAIEATTSKLTPPQAMSWVTGTPDYPNRAQQLQSLAVTWIRRDAAAARTFINSNPALTDSERSSLKGLLPANP